jgi:hypothetical protein
MEETKLQKARKKTKAAAVALAVASSALFGNMSAEDPVVHDREELRALMGRINPHSEVRDVLRLNKKGMEAVTVEVVNEDWSVDQLDTYLKRLAYLKQRVHLLREARVEFEEALADSVSDR